MFMLRHKTTYKLIHLCRDFIVAEASRVALDNAKDYEIVEVEISVIKVVKTNDK